LDARCRARLRWTAHWSNVDFTDKIEFSYNLLFSDPEVAFTLPSIIERDAEGNAIKAFARYINLSEKVSEILTTELEYFISDDYNAVLACEPGEAGMTGFECPRDPWMDMLTGEAGSLGLLRGGESISICWPSDSPDVIVRSIVIGDELWTLGFKGWGAFDGQSPARLHVNDLRTLARLAALEL